MALTQFDIRTRYLINLFFVEHGHPPTVRDLAQQHGCTENEVGAALGRLVKDRKLVLYPGTTDIWIAHPFTAIPSNYWVEAGKHGWWGNCGFCSLGISAMLKQDVRIHTRLGAEREVISGRGHSVQRTGEPFNERLQAFIDAA